MDNRFCYKDGSDRYWFWFRCKYWKCKDRILVEIKIHTGYFGGWRKLDDSHWPFWGSCRCWCNGKRTICGFIPGKYRGTSYADQCTCKWRHRMDRHHGITGKWYLCIGCSSREIDILWTGDCGKCIRIDQRNSAADGICDNGRWYCDTGNRRVGGCFFQ